MHTNFSTLGCGLAKLLVLGGVGLLLGSPDPAAAASLTNVTVGDNFFNPNAMTINVNDQVKWNWSGINSHSSTSSSTPALWDSGIHGNGFTFTTTFTSAGTFAYHCAVHALQLGSVTVQAAANTPPTVAITNPASGTILSAPATFNLSATAADPGGSVASVQFLQSGVVVSNVTTSPYTIRISNLAAGNYSFSAVATDNGGLKATNAISLTVNALPTVTVGSPTNNATFAAPWSGNVLGADGDADGTVTNVSLFAGGTLLSSLASPPASYSLPVANLVANNYALTVVAKDNRGGSTTSAVVTVHVVTPVQTVLSGATRPSAGSFQFSYSATAGLNYAVERSASLTGWQPLQTNTASSGSVVFTDSNATGTPGFYRVRRLPNP